MPNDFQPSIEWRDIESVIPYVSNTKQHPEEQIAKVAGSIAEFGWDQPIVVDGDGVIIKGHGRRLAALRLGLTKVPIVVRTDLSTAQVKAARIADNRVAESGWDTQMLTLELQDLGAEGFDLDLLGFDADELASLLNPEVAPEEGLTDPDAVPENVETRCKPGDLWVLGNHRLLCGDSTNVQHVERLMGGEKADMVFTDPPYGMAYESNAWDSAKAEVRERRTDTMIKGDETTDVAKDALRLLPTFLNDAAHLYVWCRWDCFGDFLAVCEQIAKVKSVIVWDKGGPGLGDLQCSYGDNEWAIHAMIGRRPLAERQNSVWQVNRMKGLQMVHPTQKPIELPERAISNSTQPKDAVLDLFLGSGSTLIACERLGRRCFGMELDPKYGDVILARWEQHTGKTAILQPAEGAVEP